MNTPRPGIAAWHIIACCGLASAAADVEAFARFPLPGPAFCVFDLLLELPIPAPLGGRRTVDICVWYFGAVQIAVALMASARIWYVPRYVGVRMGGNS